MPVGVMDENRPRGGNLVEMQGRQPVAREVDRVQAPDDEQLVWAAHLAFDLLDLRDDGFERRAARPDLAVGVGPIEKADIRVGPGRPLGDVAVGLHQAGNEYLLLEGVIQLVGSPALQFGERADAEDLALAHGHVRPFRVAGIHGDDLFRDEDGGGF